MESCKRRTGSADMSGELYEVYMLMLLFLRSVLHGENFELTTNVDGAGAFDDIVLWFREKIYFFQLKHKFKKPISKRDLCAVKGDFSLIKYFCSYLETKRNFPNDESEFIIYTNTLMKSSDGVSSEADSFISSEGKIFTFTDQSKEYEAFQQVIAYRETLHEVLKDKLNQEEVRNKLEEFKDLTLCKKLKELIKNRSEFEEEAKKQVSEWNLQSWNEFMKSLKLYTEQPSLEKLKVLLKEELQNVCGTKEIFLDLKEGIVNWWRKKECCDHLTDKSHDFWKEILQKHISDLTKTIQCRMAPLLGLKFQSTRNVLNTSRVTHVICKDCTELSCLRVQQSLTDIDHLLIDINVLRQHLKEVVFAWKHYQTLVVVGGSNEEGGGSSDDEVITQVSNLLCVDPENKIIFISENPDDYIIKELSKRPFTIELLTDDINLSQMNDESKNRVLECQVEFQGHRMELKNIISHPAVVTADLILDVLMKDNINIGCSVPIGNSIYIPRSLLRHEIIQIVNMFNIDLPQKHCIAFSGTTLSELKNLVPHDTVLAEFSEVERSNGNCQHFIIDDSVSFTKLCERFKNVHWIHKIEGTFQWKQSFGDITFVNNNLDTNSDPTFYNNILEILNISPHIVLLTAEPGMGKSTEMSHLARVLKEQNPATWVILVNLNEHTNILSRNDSTALELLCETGEIKTEFGKKIFEHELYHQGNIVILFDGYDEISPKYSTNVIRIMREICNKNIKVCLTSRSNMERELEMEFCCLAFSLNPLSEDEQIEFMNEFWNINNSDQEISFAQKVLDLTAKCFQDRFFNFTGNPLHTFMLAEVFKSQAMEYNNSCVFCLPQNLDILQLYEEFVDIKYQVNFEKEKSDKTNIYVLQRDKKMREILEKDHEIFSLIAFLTEEDFSTLSSSRKLKMRYQKLLGNFHQGYEKTGLITGIVNNKPIFVHRTFVEFFVAHWLSDNYECNKNLIIKNLFDVEWQTVKAFVDRILCVEFKLHTAVINQDLAVVEGLVVSREVDVNERDEGGRTALHLAVMSQNNKEYTVQQEILIVLLEHGADLNIEDELCKWKPLQLAGRMESWFAIETLIERGADKKDLVSIREKIHDHNYLISLFAFLIPQGLVHSVEFILECDVDVNFVLNQHYHEGLHYHKCTLLHMAAIEGQLPIVQLLVKCGAELEERDIERKTSVMIACERGNLEVVKFLIDQGSKLNLLDWTGESMLTLALESETVDMISCLLDSGVDVNVTNNSNETTILRAAMMEKWSIVALLLSYGADINICGADGNTLLHYVALKGCRQLVIELLDLGMNINVANKSLRTPVHLAAVNGRSEIVKLLLEHGADYMACDIYENTLVQYVAMYGTVDVMDKLLDLRIDVNMRNQTMETLSHLALRYRKPEIVKLLLEHGADQLAYDSDGNTLLHNAATYGALDIIIKLLDLKIDLNVRNISMQTPIHLAIAHKESETAKLLLEYDADHMACDIDGNTLLHYAAEFSTANIIIQLLGLGININVRNKKMQTPAHIAAAHGRSEIVKLLLENNTDHMACDIYDNTLLHYAAESSAADIIIQLLDLGININVKNKSLQTPAHIAAVHGRSKNLKLLLGNGADLMGCDSSDDTLLHFAAAYCNKDVINQLLDMGSDVNIRNKRQQTPAHIAFVYKRPGIVELFLEHGADCFACDCNGDTLLHFAVLCDDMGLVIKLLNLGLNANVRNKNLLTPVNIAATYERIDILKILVEHGGDCMAFDAEGNTLLHLAVKCQAKDIINQLLELGIDVNVLNKRMQTPAHVAFERRRLEIVKHLLERGADCFAYDCNGNTLLHYAVWYAETDIIIHLLNLGMNVNVRNESMQTPAHTAVRHRRSKIVKDLLELGADHMARDIDENTLLHYAAKQGVTDIVLQLLDLGTNVDIENKTMQTPAHLAAAQGQLEIVELLLEHGANKMSCDSDGNSLLHYAAESCSVAVVLHLLELGVNVNVKNKDLQTPAHKAVEHRGSEIVKLLLKHGADKMASDIDGDTLLHYGVRFCAIDIISHLLDQGMNVNVKNKMKQTPAHLAALHGGLPFMKLFLAHGADHMALDCNGNTLLHCSAWRGHIDIIIHLLDLGVNVDVRNKSMQTPAHIALLHGRSDIVKLLLDRGADYMACDLDGGTLLHYAAECGATVIVTKLLDLGMNVNVRNSSNQTPAHLAVAHWEDLILLLENGADLTACDCVGNTLLHYAAEKGGADIIFLLLTMGMNVNVRNENNQTPVEVASYEGKSEIVKILLDHGANLMS